MRLQHITFQTYKMEEEIEFYQDFVGLKVDKDFEVRGSRIVFLSGNEGGSFIELIENNKVKKLDSKGITVGFSCEDLDSLRKKLLEKNYTPGDIIRPNEFVEFFFVKDPIGVNIQFIKNKK